MLSKFGKVFKVAALVLIIPFAIVCFGYMLTDIPANLSKYSAAKKEAEAVGLRESWQEYLADQGITYENNGVNFVPWFKTTPNSGLFFENKDTLKQWEDNKDAVPKLEAALSKPEFKHIREEISDQSLTAWRAAILAKGYQAVQDNDVELATKLSTLASKIVEKSETPIYCGAEKIAVDALMIHWDDPKWLALVRKTLKQDKFQPDAVRFMQNQYTGMCDYLNRKDLPGQPLELKIPGVRKAVKAILHRTYAMRIRSFSSVPKLGRDVTTYLNACEDAIRKWPRLSPPSKSWRLVTSDITRQAIGTETIIIRIFRDHIDAKRNLNDAITFLESHPPKSEANKRKLVAMFSNKFTSGFYTSGTTSNRAPSYRISPLTNFQKYR